MKKINPKEPTEEELNFLQKVQKECAGEGGVSHAEPTARVIRARKIALKKIRFYC